MFDHLTAWPSMEKVEQRCTGENPVLKAGQMAGRRVTVRLQVDGREPGEGPGGRCVVGPWPCAAESCGLAHGKGQTGWPSTPSPSSHLSLRLARFDGDYIPALSNVMLSLQQPLSEIKDNGFPWISFFPFLFLLDFSSKMRSTPENRPLVKSLY